MAGGHGRIRRALVRVINDDNLDLYLLGTVAMVFTVLGITGVSDVKTTSAVVVALLALLAFSQIRSRRLIEQIRAGAHGNATALFMHEFPAELAARRARAHDILLIGDSMSRTVYGMRTEVTTIIRAGGRVRVLVLDPTDETLITLADRRVPQSLGPDWLRARIMPTLDELTAVRARLGGRLEIRVSSIIPSAGFQCLDADTPRGLVCVQHHEYRETGSAAPIFTLEPKDGAWYQHFVAEAERLWAAGTDWPLSAAAAVGRARRPAFSAGFGAELDAAIDEATDLHITGVARNVLVNARYRQLERKLLAGHRIRFLLVDPDSPAIDTVTTRRAGRSADGTRDRVRQTLRLLDELRKVTDGDLTVRLTAHPIAVGVIATDVGLFAQYYPYQGREEPSFALRPGDVGHDVFLDEIETLWRQAAD